MGTYYRASDAEVEITRYKRLPTPLKVLFLVLTFFGMALSVYYTFGFSIGGVTLINYSYYMLFITIFSPCVFLLLPARKKDKTHVPWYDLVLLAITMGIGFFFFLHSREMSVTGWENIPLGAVFAITLLEGARRSGGNIFLGVILLFTLFPLFADKMPGILWGHSYRFDGLVESMVFRGEGLLGLTAKVASYYIMGFLVFGGVLIASGAGDFFLNLAIGVFGKVRGGPAKVSVMSSALFGSISGSIFSNIIADGFITIPVMKRTGYPAHYAAAIEACTSTGGVIMPPVMGAVAFVMCEFLGIEYGKVIIAAAIPSFLYFYGLFMQIDCYAAKMGMKGLTPEEIPSIKKTLKIGWPFVAVLVFLTWGLVWMRWEFMTPWYASLLLIALSFINKETRMGFQRLRAALVQIGSLVTQTVALIIPIGFIVAGLTITGVTGSFTAGLVDLGQGNVFFILLLGAVACYIMGMAGMSTAAYIFLAATMAPAVLKAGPDLNVLAVHMFILYYAMLSAITPPVAAGSFLAANIAGADPMKTAWQSMRLAIVIYFIPFFFVFKPALILQGSPLEAAYLLIFCVIGIGLIAAGIEGYLHFFGVIRAWWARALLIIGGFLFAFPEWITTVIGGAIALVTIALVWKIYGRRLEIKKFSMPLETKKPE